MRPSINKFVLSSVSIAGLILSLTAVTEHNWNLKRMFFLTAFGSVLWGVGSLMNVFTRPEPNGLFLEQWCKLIWIYSMMSLVLFLGNYINMVAYAIIFIVASLVAIPVIARSYMSYIGRRP